MAIYTQIDISSDVETILNNFKKYILDRTDNLRECLCAIERGNPIEIEDWGKLDLNTWTSGGVYCDFVHVFFGRSLGLDYRVCDAAINYCISTDILFKRFVKAVALGVTVCDMKKQRERQESKRFLAVDPNHGMFHQAEVFLDHFSTDPPKLG